MVSSKCQNEAHTLPSIVVRTSFKIFRALFGVRPRMCRLSQALQIKCSCIKHELTVQIIFMSEMGVNKVRDQRNRRDNYLVSEIVSQLCNNLKNCLTTNKSLFAGEAVTTHRGEPC